MSHRSLVCDFIIQEMCLAVGLVRTVVSISHCGCDDPGSIPGLDRYRADLMRFNQPSFLFAKFCSTCAGVASILCGWMQLFTMVAALFMSHRVCNDPIHPSFCFSTFNLLCLPSRKWYGADERVVHSSAASRRLHSLLLHSEAEAAMDLREWTLVD
eukprot:scaffold2425_cov76-Skeletonema_dohrnii-CCMP3373.AAC.28